MHSHFIGVLVDQRNIVIIKCSSILLLEALTTIFLNLKWMGGLKFVILSRVVGTSTKWYANMLTRVKLSLALLYFFAFIEISEFFFIKILKEKMLPGKGWSECQWLKILMGLEFKKKLPKLLHFIVKIINCYIATKTSFINT